MMGRPPEMWRRFPVRTALRYEPMGGGASGSSRPKAARFSSGVIGVIGVVGFVILIRFV